MSIQLSHDASRLSKITSRLPHVRTAQYVGTRSGLKLDSVTELEQSVRNGICRRTPEKNMSEKLEAGDNQAPVVASIII